MYLFIINQHAGNGNGALIWRKLERQLLEKEMTFQAILSDSEQASEQLIDRFVEDHPIQVLVVIGGDGTIHSVLKKAKEYALPLAIFPTGSGNDTARMFNLTHQPAVFIERLLAHEVKTIDLLQVNDHVGITVVGTGIDAAIGKTVNESFYKSLLGKIKLGSVSYLIAVFQAAIYFKSFQASIQIDGKVQHFDRTWLIACGNTTSYGSGLKICPTADPNDGQLHVTIFHHLHKMKALSRIFPTLLRGKKVEKEGIYYAVGKEITIETNRPIDVILDGEIIATTPLHIQIHSKALQLIQT